MCPPSERNFLVKSFLPTQVFQKPLERIISIKEANVIYKPFMERIMSHFVFKSEFESVLLSPCCLLDYVPKSLLVGKLGY